MIRDNKNDIYIYILTILFFLFFFILGPVKTGPWARAGHVQNKLNNYDQRNMGSLLNMID